MKEKIIKGLIKTVGIFLLGLFVQSLISEIYGFTIIQPLVKPIKDYLNPLVASLIIEPLPNPLPTGNGTHIIKVSVTNNGTKDLEKIWIDYRFLCTMNETKRTYLENRYTLAKGESDTFQFEVKGLNPQCSITLEPPCLKFYQDRYGRYYIKTENTTNKVCLYCPIDINITATNFYQNYTRWYPYFEGSVDLSFIDQPSSFRTYEDAVNKSEFIYLPEMDICLTVYDISTYCLRGDEPSYCNQFRRK